MSCLRLALTSGEPAGIGPDLAIMLALQDHPHEIVTLACRELIEQRAVELGINIRIETFSKQRSPEPNIEGVIKLLDIPCEEKVVSGELNTKNAAYVLRLLDTAIDGCQTGIFHGMITAPVQKSVINDAGIAFSGHTEYLADALAVEKVVMMLATAELRVALATTHLPLKDVANSISEALLHQVIEILDNDLKQFFAIDKPNILVAGLNPHAGENGHLGNEEIDTIIPALNALRAKGIKLQGPLPADTLFTEKYLQEADAVLAMYHDQGLPVLKYQGFGRAANITLGLPIIRTSVDHGTALDLAGTGKIDNGSLQTAVNIAVEMASAQLRSSS